MSVITAEAVQAPSAAEPAGASLLTSTRVVASRTIRTFMRTPQLIIFGTIQGAMFLLIFRYVFGGAIEVGGIPYVDYLVPGFITTGILFAGTAAATGVAEDLEKGVVDRLRSLPIPRAAVLAGRALADTALLSWNLAITAAVGFAVGFRLHGSVSAGVAALALCIVFGFALSWLFITIGLVTRNAQAAQGAALLVFPLTFVSSAYVQVEDLPGWLQPIAEHQPITIMVDAVRSLALGSDADALLGHSTGWFVVRALAWCAVIVAIFASAAVALFRRS